MFVRVVKNMSVSYIKIMTGFLIIMRDSVFISIGNKFINHNRS